MGPIFSVADLMDMVRRRAGVIFLIIFVGCLLSVVWALSQQHEYESAEVIQIAQPKIADDLASSTVEGSSARRLQLIQQVLMTRGSVLEVIDKYDLYADMPDMLPQAKVDRLRRSIRIEGVAAAREGYTDDGTISVLTITARMDTPELAQQIALEFGNRTLALSEQNRIENARETLAFFDAREEALRIEIASLEDDITGYRNEHQLSLPGAVEFRREEIGTINEGLLDIARERIEIERAMELAGQSERKATAERLKKDFEEQLATLQAQRQLLLDRKFELETLIEGSPEVERQLGAYSRQLDQLRDELDQIASRRTEAELGFRLEAERQAERLTVIEEAAIPDYPVTGSRKRKALMGGMVSVFLAFAFAYFLELRNPVLRSAAQMERELGIKPVVSVPHLDTRPKRRSFWARLGGLFGGGADRTSPAE